MPTLFEIFRSFFRIGTFTVGGGYAMIPLMQHELVERHHWLTEEEFLDHVALSQAMPGVFAVNMATMTGYRLRKGWGSAVAIVGNILMPVVFILLLAIFFRTFRDNPYVERIFLGLRPAVVALIAAPVFTLWRNEKRKQGNTSLETQQWISRIALYMVPLTSALLIWLLGVNPILVVLLAALAGFIYSKLRP